MKLLSLKKVISILMLACIFSVACISDYTYAAESNTPSISIEETNSNPRIILLETTKTKTVTHSSGNTIKIKATIVYRDESSNSTGHYIVNVEDLTITSYSGWVKATNASIISKTYSNNCQTVTVKFSYQASIGEGYTTYTAQVSFTV